MFLMCSCHILEVPCLGFPFKSPQLKAGIANRLVRMQDTATAASKECVGLQVYFTILTLGFKMYNQHLLWAIVKHVNNACCVVKAFR